MIFESGLAASSISWTFVQPAVAQFTRTCSYDRAGLGFSPLAQAPRTLENISAELREMLQHAAVPPPYVLVGHSYGAMIVRHFAHIHPADVGGLVFVDPVCTTHWCNITEERRRSLARGVMLSRRGAWLAKLGVVRFSSALLMSGSRRIPKLIAKASSGRASGVADRLVGEIRKLPKETWPLLSRQWSQPKCFEAMAEYLRYLPANAEEASALNRLDRFPLAVLSSAAASPEELREHQSLAALSPNGKHRIADGAGHWIPLDRPDLVVEAVRWVVSEVRGTAPDKSLNR